MRAARDPAPRHAGLRGLALALLLPGCGAPPPAPPRAPAPSPPPAAPPSVEGLVARLRQVRREIEADPTVVALFEAAPGTPVDEVWRLWHVARDVYRTRVRDQGLRKLSAELAGLTPTPAVLDEVSRFLLVHRLLARSPQDDSGPLFPPGEGPDLERVLRVCLAVRRDPRFDGTRAANARARRALYLPELEASGRTWVALRTLEELAREDMPTLQTGLRLRGYSGITWRDPSDSVPDFLVDHVQNEDERRKIRTAPEEVSFPLRPVEGDLMLLLSTWMLQQSRHMVLDLVGQDETVRLLFSTPREDVAGPAPAPEVAAGYLVRIRATCVPRGARRVRARVVGLEGVAASNPIAHLGEVYQQLRGPVPAAYSRHEWKAHGSKALNEREVGRMTMELAPMLELQRLHPEDPAGSIGAGLLLLDYEQYEAAAARLEEAERLRPGDPRALDALGRARWNLGRYRAAADAWWACFQAAPAGPALDRLRRYTPDEVAGHVLVGDAREILELARYLREFRRLDEVQAALDAYREARGSPMSLTEGDWRGGLEQLHREGYLARPGGPPSGRGAFLTEAGARVYSTTFGTRLHPEGGPPALRAPRGFSLAPAALRTALDSPETAAFELGVHHLDDAGLLATAAGLSKAALTMGDPWAQDALLRRLERAATTLPPAQLSSFRAFLEHLLAQGDATQKTRARRLAERLGPLSDPPR